MFDKRILQLIDALASMIFFVQDTIPFLLKAHIKPGEIALVGNANVFWFNIVKYAFDNNQLDALVNALRESYPNNPHLLAFMEPKIQDYSLGSDIKNEVNWHHTDQEILEKIIGKTNTLLPINFLSIGLEKAKSIARVVIPRNQKEELGTGFLTTDNWFITNNHVIESEQTARLAKIEFNYEESMDGNPIAPETFYLDPDSGFGTSKEDDWTIIKVKGDANKNYGKIQLLAAPTFKGDFVNIIQHPGGRYKQIGLYHNMVTYCNDQIVQYLTDTEPGTSGAPVFNSHWELVALHHSGGMLREPGSAMRLMRNEGINIQKIIDGTKHIISKG